MENILLFSKVLYPEDILPTKDMTESYNKTDQDRHCISNEIGPHILPMTRRFFQI